MSSRPAADYRYDVCLSYASEQRAYVREVAEGLAGHGVRCFYDEDLTVELWGEHLPGRLDEAFRTSSRYCVLFISSEYAAKTWTNHEFRSALARSLQAGGPYILPARFDDTELAGLPSTTASVDLRHTTVARLVELIIAKLASSNGAAAVPAVSSGARTLRIDDEPTWTASLEHEIWAMCYLPNGCLAVATRKRAGIDIWDADGNRRAALIGPKPVTGVACSPDGRLLAGLGFINRTIWIWDSESGRCIRKIAHPRLDPMLKSYAVLTVAFNPEGTLLAAGCMDHRIRIVDPTTGALVRELRAEGVLKAVVYSPDGSQLASAGNEGVVQVRDAGTGALLHVIAGHTDRISSLGYSPDSTRLASAGTDRILRIWDTRTGELTATGTGHAGGISKVAFHPDGAALITGGADGTVRIWDAETAVQRQILADQGGAVRALSVDRRGDHVAAGGHDGVLRVRRVRRAVRAEQG